MSAFYGLSAIVRHQWNTDRHSAFASVKVAGLDGQRDCD